MHIAQTQGEGERGLTFVGSCRVTRVCTISFCTQLPICAVVGANGVSGPFPGPAGRRPATPSKVLTLTLGSSGKARTPLVQGTI